MGFRLFFSKVWSVHKGNHKSCGQAVLQIGNRIIVGGGIGRVDFSKPRVLKTAEVTIQGIIGAMQATLWALDLETGETVWETKLGESLFPLKIPLKSFITFLLGSLLFRSQWKRGHPRNSPRWRHPCGNRIH